jgi:hypothetical protein
MFQEWAWPYCGERQANPVGPGYCECFEKPAHAGPHRCCEDHEWGGE